MIAVRLHPAARREIRRAFEWYIQEASPRVAAGFLDDFEHTQALLKEHPEIGNAVSTRLCAQAFNHVPGFLTYRFSADIISIHAVAHEHRRPGYWAERR